MAMMRRKNPSDLLKGKQTFSKKLATGTQPLPMPIGPKPTEPPVLKPPVGKRKKEARNKALRKFAGGN